mmetsp:Transcript_13521/g.30686  ORF Transcript_13521/g.30686 Transcript_13521/m.30686 type:complete len:251 (-) Transcript_13521:639-1391(-)
MQPVLVDDALVGVSGEVLAILAVHVQAGGELEPLVDLGHRVGGEIIFEAAEMQLEHGRERLEVDALLRILLAVSLRVVLVLAIEDLLLDILIERCVQVLAALDWDLQVVEVLVTQRRVLHVDAAHIVRELAAEEVGHRALDAGPLHLLLELIHQHAVELLDVVLHERIVRVPAEAFGELLCADARVAVLKLVEDPLQRQRDARLGVFAIRGMHVVHRLPKVREVSQRLQQRVHVASGPLVLEANVARLLL